MSTTRRAVHAYAPPLARVIERRVFVLRAALGAFVAGYGEGKAEAARWDWHRITDATVAASTEAAAAADAPAAAAAAEAPVATAAAAASDTAAPKSPTQ